MNTKRIVLWSVVFVVIIGITTGAFYWMHRPQTVVLHDGTKLILLGVTYGKRHIPPSGKNIPRRIQFTTPDDTLCVWLREEFTNANPEPYSILAFNGRGDFNIGRAIPRRTRAGRNANAVALRFDSFPRAEGKMRLRVRSPDLTNSPGEFAISFPAQKIISDWRPLPLPITQQDGELAVTLTKLAYGTPSFNRNMQAATNAIGKAVIATFRIEENEMPTRNWRLVEIESWDPTGNRAASGSRPNRRNTNEITLVYPSALSPELPAWKLRAEFMRESNFTEDEFWKVGPVPVATNAPLLGIKHEATNFFTRVAIGESMVEVFPITARTNPAGLQLRVTVTPPLSPHMHLTLVSALDEQGKKIIPSRQDSSDSNFIYEFTQTNAKVLDVTLALHHSHFVEFIAKPEMQ